MNEVNKEELRRLAGHASTGGWDRKRVFGQLNIQDDNHMLGDNDAAFIAAANPAVILSLLDENDAREKKARETSLLWLNENAQLRAENESLREELGGIKNVSAVTTQAMKRLVMYARTSGGSAGPDQGLMDACEQAEKMLSLGGVGRAYMDGADAAMAKEGNANP